MARSEKILGSQSVAVSWRESLFGYPADEILWRSDTNFISQELSRWRLLRRVVRDFDVVHYNYGTPILNWGALDGRHRQIGCGLGNIYASVNQAFELPFLKRMGKLIVVTYQGDDARQGDYCRANFDISIADEVGNEYYSDIIDATKRARIAKFANSADLIYALNPDLLRVLPSRAKFLPYAHIDLNDWSHVGCSHKRDRPLIVHAPSHKGAKGTNHLLEAISRMRNEGYDFEFRLVEGLPRREAKKLYEIADLVVDQLLAGWYGGFAVEAMALGKPVICYLRREDFCFLPPKMVEDLPIIEASPATIENVLKEWISMSPAERQARGCLGRKYVECWHDPIQIAGRVLKDYQEASESREN
ncbi:MAG: glycosyltransferase family 4 protein [Rhodospirillales bacterium]|nr:glycosyltransferase family 4 protein [Rhodospirillales bacterium]